MSNYIKHISGFLIIFTILLFLYTCDFESPCPNSYRPSGRIASVLELGKCFYLMKDTTYVIRNYKDYDNLFLSFDSVFNKTPTFKSQGCDTVGLPYINFKKYSLLGFLTEGEGCVIAFQRNVTIDDDLLKYIYTVTVHECGYCNVKKISMNWVLVPRIPDLYKVEFVINKSERDSKNL